MRIFSCLVLIIAFSCVSIGVCAEERTFNSTQFEFSLHYPQEFVSYASNVTEVPLALRHRTQGYPSFNVTVEAGAYNPYAHSIEEQRDQVLQSYRQVGISEIHARTWELRNLKGISLFYTELEGSHANKNYGYAVIVVPGIERHLILTFVDNLPNFENSRPLLEALLAGLEYHGSVPLRATSKRWLVLVVAGGSLILVIGIIYVLIRSSFLGKKFKE
jgi:hypothetical protein